MSSGVPEPDPGRSGVEWGRFFVAEPELAARVRERFEEHGRHVLATRTVIGSPRVSGAVTGWWRDEMWVAAPAGARWARDLRSDARVALHSNPGDGSGPDVKIGGIAVELVPGALHDDLVEDALLDDPVDVFLLRLRTVRLAPSSDDREASGPVRWRAGGATHRH